MAIGMRLRAGAGSLLANLDPQSSSLADLVAAAEAFGPPPFVVEVPERLRPLALLAPTAALDGAIQVSARREQALREIVSRLEATIAARERQDELWPEGRLNAGIALAALGEHQRARARLEEAIAVLQGRDPRASAESAMAV